MTKSLQVFNSGRWKGNFRLHRYYAIIFSIDISPLFTVGLSSNLHKQNQIDDLHLYFNMTCDTINLVFNKMEETFQSNTLDWSSLVLYDFDCPFITLLILEGITSNLNYGLWKRNFRLPRYYVINIFNLENLCYILSDWYQTCFYQSRMMMTFIS